jgi:hypothetical protein
MQKMMDSSFAQGPLLAVFCLSRQAAIGQKLPFVMGSYPATSGVQIIH